MSPRRALAAKTVVTGLDATMRRPPASRSAESTGTGTGGELPMLDLTSDGTGDFHIVQTIGSGGMGYVSLARQHSLQRDVSYYDLELQLLVDSLPLVTVVLVVDLPCRRRVALVAPSSARASSRSRRLREAKDP